MNRVFSEAGTASSSSSGRTEKFVDWDLPGTGFSDGSLLRIAGGRLLECLGWLLGCVSCVWLVAVGVFPWRGWLVLYFLWCASV